MVGAAAVVLNYVRSGEFEWSLIWTGFRRWTSSFLLGLWPGGLYAVFGLLPFLYILVPIPLALYLWLTFAYFSLAEDGATYGYAVRNGLRLVTGSFWPAVLFALIALVGQLAGVVACCIGVFLTIAFVQVLEAVAYNSLMRGSPAASD